MAHEKFFISDTHFFHQKIIEYCNRPYKTADGMNIALVNNWNSVVGKNDYVYHLGDVALGYGESEKELNEILFSLNGKKRLIVGNHDKLKSPVLHRAFEKIDLWKGFKDQDFTCVHIPLELASLRDGKFCVHGHIHNNLRDDPHYINVCVEHHNYTPVHLDVILERIKSVK